MAIYSDRVDKLLRGFNPAHNKLFEYDNYTYHIQFFLVDKDCQKEYSQIRFANLDDSSGELDETSQYAKEANKVLEGHKVIIAESGVTNDISIDSLVIQSVPGFGGDDGTYSASTEFKLKIKEIAGNGLVNKIHLATKLLQYNSYIATPFFISIWFSGYQNTDKERIVPKIPNIFNGLDALTFQVIIEDVKTNVGVESTTYDMTLRPITDLGLFADFSNIQDIKIKEIVPGTYLTTILQQIEDSKNEEIRKRLNGSFEGIYGNKIEVRDDSGKVVRKTIDPNQDNSAIKAFEIKIIEKIPNYEELNIEVNHDKNYLERKLEKAENSFRVHKDDYSTSDAIFEHAGNVGASSIKDAEEMSFGESINPIGWKKIKSGAKMLWTFITSIFGTVVKAEEWVYNTTGEILTNSHNNKVKNEIDQIMNTRWSEAGCWPGINTPFEPKQANSLQSIITELFFICCPGIDALPTYNYKTELAGEYNGKAYYKVTMYISFVHIPGYKYLLNKDARSDKSKPLMFSPDIIDDIQADYILEIAESGALLKKYYYLLNGRDESILSYDINEDLFWYLNTGMTEEKFAIEQSANVKRELIENEIVEQENNTLKLKDMINRKMGIDKNKKHKDYNINEVANMVDASVAEQFGYQFMIGSEAQDIWVKSQSTVTANDDEKKEDSKQDRELMKINKRIQEAKIGAQNMLSHGQKVELKLKILGDPYWLSFNPEDVQISRRALPHLIMDIKTFSKLDSFDNPVEDEMMRFISLYRITDITSTFQDGQFTQDLHGYVATPFVHGYNPNYEEVIGEVHDNYKDKTYNIVQDKSGNVRVIGRELDDDVNSMKGLIDSYKQEEEIGMSGIDSRYTVTDRNGTMYNVDYIRQSTKVVK